MTRLIRVALLSVLTAAFTSTAQAAPVDYIAQLDGPSVNAPVVTPGTGTAHLIIDDVAHTMRVMVDFADLIGATTLGSIHCCTAPPGNVAAATLLTGPTLFPAGVSTGTYDNTFDMTLSSSFFAAFITASGGTTALAEDALFAGIAAGEVYLTVHTTSFPGGEIRGFFEPVVDPGAVPEPGSLGVLLVGFGALFARRQSR